MKGEIVMQKVFVFGYVNLYQVLTQTLKHVWRARRMSAMSSPLFQGRPMCYGAKSSEGNAQLQPGRSDQSRTEGNVNVEHELGVRVVAVCLS